MSIRKSKSSLYQVKKQEFEDVKSGKTMNARVEMLEEVLYDLLFEMSFHAAPRPLEAEVYEELKTRMEDK